VIHIYITRESGDNNMVVKLCIHIIYTASVSDDKISWFNDICYIVKSETKIPNAHEKMFSEVILYRKCND
jgi:hypothetical protein